VCEPGVRPGTQPEVCNGLDDDCDGEVDEGDICPGKQTCCAGRCVNTGNDEANCGECGRRCDSGETCCGGTCVREGTACDTRQPGICAEGTLRCVDDRPTCTRNTAPRAEVCNGLDDDCDGEVDEGDLCPGKLRCLNGSCGCLTAADCPGQDTDCRRRTCVDAVCGVAFAADGTAVPEQTRGDCQRRVCDGAGNVVSRPDDGDLPNDANPCTANVCSAGQPSHPPLPAGRTCPGGVCDGEGHCGECVPGASRACYTGPAGTEDVGICRAGTQTCLGNRSWGACQNEVTPRTEVCNGADDDCDGVVDEGDLCPGEQTCCAGRCVTTGDDEANCGACGNRCAAGETCCGGSCLGEGAPCTSSLPGVCAAGTQQCVDGAIVCEPGVRPGEREEVCNGLDDDCDGVVDNDTNCGENTCCAGDCVDTDTDVRHCGACGNDCATYCQEQDPPLGVDVCALGTCICV
jgi:hypothetical protein